MPSTAPSIAPCNRAGIGDILGTISTAVDAGQHEIGLFLHQMTHAHDDAIGRRTFDREMPFADLAHAQRIIQRQRMRYAGLIRFRCHDPHFIGKRTRNFLAGGKPRRMNAVVIGDENTHYARFNLWSMPPI